MCTETSGRVASLRRYAAQGRAVLGCSGASDADSIIIIEPEQRIIMLGRCLPATMARTLCRSWDSDLEADMSRPLLPPVGRQPSRSPAVPRRSASYCGAQRPLITINVGRSS